jgi:phage recombination protein Bet
MNGQLQNYPPPTPFLSDEECNLLKRTLLAKYAEDEQETFIRICQRTRLDPFTKQIYATKRTQRTQDEHGVWVKVPTLVPVTGIMGLTAVADRTNDYEGCEIFWVGKDGIWREEWLAEEPPEAAKSIVYHKRRKHPEVGIARWGAYVGQAWDNTKKEWYITDFWLRMPDYMLGKCAKAQALRGAFPDPLANVFIREELDSEITDTETGARALDPDAAKVAETQAMTERMFAEGKISSRPLGTPVEAKPGPLPTPEESSEPAFAEDRIPPKSSKPKPAQAKPAEGPSSATSSRIGVSTASVPPAPTKPEPALEAEPAPISLAEEAAAGGGAEQPEIATPWKDHVILGVTDDRFKNRRIGELEDGLLGIIETQWLPIVRQKWDRASDAQKADAMAFEAAIAFHKMKLTKPW